VRKKEDLTTLCLAPQQSMLKSGSRVLPHSTSTSLLLSVSVRLPALSDQLVVCTCLPVLHHSKQVPPRYALPDGPLRMAAPVVKGFGRGSRQMGTPTANMDPEPLASTLAHMHQGVYYGWAVHSVFCASLNQTQNKGLMCCGWARSMVSL
jgi:hypothetical protein